MNEKITVSECFARFLAPKPADWIGFEKCKHGVEFAYACEICDLDLCENDHERS